MLGTHEVVVNLIASGYYATEYKFYIMVKLQEIVQPLEEEEEVYEFDF